jgi:hypothetical protein
MAPEAPTTGTVLVGSTSPVSQRAGRASRDVEQQVAHVPEAVLDVVAEHPQVQQVADDVDPAPVQEHRGDDGQGHVGQEVVTPAERLVQAGRHEAVEPYQGVGLVGV